MSRVVLDVSRRARAAFSLASLKPLAQKILKAEGLLRDGETSISLVFVSDAEIKKLNARHRAKNEPTDVLSFSFLEGDDWPSDGCIGEIIISVDTLRKQAKAQKHALHEEARVLFVHGLLHVLGYDHEKPSDLKAMLALEQKHLGDKAGLIGRAQAESKMSSHQKRNNT